MGARPVAKEIGHVFNNILSCSFSVFTPKQFFGPCTVSGWIIVARSRRLSQWRCDSLRLSLPNLNRSG